MSKLGFAGICAFVSAALVLAGACKTTGSALDSGTAGSAGGGGPGTGGALGDGAVNVADGGEFRSTGRCKVHADCARNEVCMTEARCDEGFCYPIPAACAAKGDFSCACVGDVLCPRAYCSPSPAGCLTCGAPP